MSEAVIEIKDVHFGYGKKETLSGVSLRVERGHIFGFIGPNGAGKSTTIKSILGLVFPKSGSIQVHGQSPENAQIKRKIGFLPEEANYYSYLTPLEILHFYGLVSGMNSALIGSRSKELLALVGMEAVARKKIGTFSKGMKQKISLAQSLLHDPETLILDEPTSGLDPIAKADLRHLLQTLKDRGKTIFFSSHELSEVELLCDSVAIIKAGKIILSGPVGEVVPGGTQNLEKLFIELMKGEKND